MKGFSQISNLALIALGIILLGGVVYFVSNPRDGGPLRNDQLETCLGYVEEGYANTLKVYAENPVLDTEENRKFTESETKAQRERCDQLFGN